ncbi:MAG: aminotransferase class V-fold PLP-dependent enzyme [Chloroflexi bacterium]|nr:aminotransferase class V-fold PLP-dependent enzyme [Chloroflexota bacterium]
MHPPRIFLDHTATTPPAPGVFEAMVPYFTERWSSPAATYRNGRAMKRDVDSARARIGALLGAAANEIIFTSSGTESVNLAIRGVAAASQHRGRHIITTRVEHRAVLDTAAQLEREGWRVTYVPVDSHGVVDVGALESALTDETILVSVMLANNEVGSLQPVREIARSVKEHHPSVPVYTDAIAAAGYLPLDVERLGVDLLSLSAHKVGGPKGAGLLWVRRGVLLRGILHGDDRERGRRAGQEDVPAIIGLARALELALPEWSARAAHAGGLSARLMNGISNLVPGTTVTGHPTDRLPQIASFCFDGVDGEALLLQLDVQGMAAASGSACASATLAPSHVLQAMGLPQALAEGNLRLSLGIENTDEEIDRVLEVLPGVIERIRALRR